MRHNTDPLFGKLHTFNMSSCRQECVKHNSGTKKRKRRSMMSTFIQVVVNMTANFTWGNGLSLNGSFILSSECAAFVYGPEGTCVLFGKEALEKCTQYPQDNPYYKFELHYLNACIPTSLPGKCWFF